MFPTNSHCGGRFHAKSQEEDAVRGTRNRLPVRSSAQFEYRIEASSPGQARPNPLPLPQHAATRSLLPGDDIEPHQLTTLPVDAHAPTRIQENVVKVLRILGIALGCLVGALVLVSITARFSDGPIAIFAGGPLIVGPLIEGPEPDWSFAREIDTIEFQLLSPARSRRTWVVESGGRAYVPCGYMDSPIGRTWKKWPFEAERDGRAIVRIAGKRYERQLLRVRDATVFADLSRELERKYGVPASGDSVDEGGLWIFELAPRASVGSR